MTERPDSTYTAASIPQDGDTHALFPRSSILLSSEGSGWQDIRAERLRLTLETPEHHHDEHFLTLHLGPPALVEVKEGKRHLRIQTVPGTFSLIGAEEPHQVRYEGANVLGVSLYPHLLNRLAEDVTRENGVILLPQHSTQDPQVERIGQLLKAELESGCPSGALFADAMGQALAVHLLRNYSSAPVKTDEREWEGLPPARLRQVLDYLEAHLDRDITLAELAEVAGLSVYHFARQFKAATGMAPHAYLISRRIERAKELLTRTTLPIAAVAATAGFAHQSHLNRHFKRLVGTTPARYR